MEPVFSHQPVEQQYKFWRAQVEGDDPYVGLTTVGIKDVLKAHFLLQDYFIDRQEGVGGMGPRDLNLLHSALSRQTTGFDGRSKWFEPLDVCSTLFYGLIKNHPFHDCNKRTALLTLLYHLEQIGRCPSASQGEFENIAVSVAESGLDEYTQFNRFRHDRHDQEIKFISHFLKRSTREADKRFYLITCKQLRVVLQHFGFDFEGPDNGVLHLRGEVEERRLFGLSRRKVTGTILCIPFHTWNSEVSRKTISKVRTVCKLTPEFGIDSEVFYKMRDPMKTFMQTFEGPLRRLARR